MYPPPGVWQRFATDWAIGAPGSLGKEEARAETFRGNPAGNQPRPAELGQQPEASLGVRGLSSIGTLMWSTTLVFFRGQASYVASSLSRPRIQPFLDPERHITISSETRTA